jgi:hypothetical protein
MTASAANAKTVTGLVSALLRQIFSSLIKRGSFKLRSPAYNIRWHCQLIEVARLVATSETTDGKE